MNSDLGPVQRIDLGTEVQILNHEPEFLGNYSFVYKGAVRGELVAVKVIRLTGNVESVKRKVAREVAVWGSSNHGNIHPFYGFARGQAFGQFGALISPWCANGDANQYLSRHGERMVMTERINIWKGVIEGVIYLHEQNPPIVHGDLKPGNILIDDSGTPRICDFGLARVFLDEGSTGMTTTTEHTGTTRYLAPELVASDVTVYPTLSSDLYALGCLGLEFIYLQKPYSERINNLRGQIFQDIRKGTPPASRPPKEGWLTNRVWPFIRDLWNKDPNLRPSASNTVEAINHTELTLPSPVIQRIVHFTAIFHYPSSEWIGVRWKDYYKHLYNLCLVSRECWAWVTPTLYREIRFYPEDSPERPGSRNLWQKCTILAQTLNKSAIRVVGFGSTPGGYGSYTKVLILTVNDSQRVDGCSTALVVRGLLRFMTTLNTVIFCKHMDRYPARSEKIHTLSTLHYSFLSTLFILPQISIFQSSVFLRRLCISLWHEHPPVMRGALVLPNLQELAVRKDLSVWERLSGSLIAYISSWEMPRLHTVELESTDDIGIDDLNAFFLVHGQRVLHLTWLSNGINEHHISSIMSFCSNMRTISISSLAFLTSHSSLEAITVELGDHISNPSILPLLDLRSTASTQFPSLKDAQMKWRSPKRFPPSHLHKWVNACAVFRVGKDAIMVSEELADDENGRDRFVYF